MMEHYRVSDEDNEVQLQEAVENYIARRDSEYMSDLDEIESMYGHMPEILAQNASLMWSVAARSCKAVIMEGPDRDALILTETATQTLHNLIQRLTAQDKVAGYSLLATIYSTYGGAKDYDEFHVNLREFSDRMQYLRDNFETLELEEKSILQEVLLEKCNQFIDWGFLYMEGVFDEKNMAHEGGDIGDFHHYLYAAHCAPYLLDRMHDDTHPRIGSQFYRRLICEARYFYPHATSEHNQQIQSIS